MFEFASERSARSGDGSAVSRVDKVVDNEPATTIEVHLAVCFHRIATGIRDVVHPILCVRIVCQDSVQDIAAQAEVPPDLHRFRHHIVVDAVAGIKLIWINGDICIVQSVLTST